MGEALAPLASIYENSAMYPEGTRRTYSADETVNLLKNFSSTHASEYRDGNINISYLGDPDTYKSAGLVDYYKANLDYRDKVPSAGGAQGSGAGLGRSVLEMAQGMSSLFKIAFGGNSLEEANKLIDPFVEPSSDMVGEWITRNGGQGLVFGLQGNTYEQYAKNTKLGADLLLMGMPGSASQAGKVEQVAKVAEAAKAEGKLAQQLHDLESVLPPEKPTGYSVAFETALNPADFGRSRDVHFNRSNAALDNALSMDSAFAQMMETLIPNIKSSVSKVGGRQTPSGWTWEHASSSTAFNQEGIMRLVPTAQHTPSSPWWRVLHPDAGAAGGYSEWAIPRGAPKN
ncbi:hypothetical protein AB6N16_00815 [Pseudomonas marginalis]